MYYSIQYLRAFAAFIVVLTHVDPLVMRGLNRIFIGSIGVDLFFIISGFVMALLSEGAPAKVPINKAVDFLVRRIIRLWPLYGICTLIAFLIEYLLLGRVVRSSSHIAYSLIFLPFSSHGYRDPILTQGWTLTFEMLFYAFIAASLLSIYAKRVALTALLTLGCMGLFFRFTNPHFVLITNPLFIEFLIGYFVFYVQRQLQALPNLALFNTLAIIIFISAMTGVDSGWTGGVPRMEVTFGHSVFLPRLIAWGIPALFLFVAVLKQEACLKRRPIKGLLLLGDASYSLYLTHTIVSWYSIALSISTSSSAL
jgi:exopolysaccharide production protein ExoZ